MHERTGIRNWRVHGPEGTPYWFRGIAGGLLQARKASVRGEGWHWLRRSTFAPPGQAACTVGNQDQSLRRRQATKPRGALGEAKTCGANRLHGGDAARQAR